MSYNEKRFTLVLRITRIVLTFVFYVFWVSIVSSLVAVIGLLIFNPEFLIIQLSDIANLLDSTFAATNFVDVFGDQTLSLQVPLIMVGVAASLSSVFGIWILGQLRGVLLDVNEKQPFSDNNAKRLFNISYGLIGLSFVSPLLQSLVVWSVVRQLEGTFLDGFSYRMNLGLLFMAALLYILSHIFSYGAHLQEEVDGTV